MARTHKTMSGMEMLTKINAPKKKAETSLQNLGSAISTMLKQRQEKGNAKLKDYYKKTGSYPG